VDKSKQSRIEEWKEEFPELADEIDKACSAHGEDDLVVLRTRGGAAIFRTPTGAECNRFTSEILDDKPGKKAGAGGNLCRSCVVFPTKQVFAGWLERYGMIVTFVLPHLMRLGGSEAVERGKE